MKLDNLNLLFIAMLAVPIVANADSAQGSSVQKSDRKNVIVASVYDDKDQPCYAGGQYVGNCSRNSPYYNVLNGECYSSLQDCKQADGDLSAVQGNGSCVRCGK
ncbi:hypothetical protein [Sulfuricurvum sp.]|uniref:hypothetical protein n=1 Tax=Sulfuricurvum sp. TaxID=2025608 RepID=UPI0025D5909F|nr:hypothetical protein [Sulfuricurvum sp.]